VYKLLSETFVYEMLSLPFVKLLLCICITYITQVLDRYAITAHRNRNTVVHI